MTKNYGRVEERRVRWCGPCGEKHGGVLLHQSKFRRQQRDARLVGPAAAHGGSGGGGDGAGAFGSGGGGGGGGRGGVSGAGAGGRGRGAETWPGGSTSGKM